ncbi:MAG: phosphoribosylamine--glycine ligase [Flavobacteriaceae bacterium]|nr:phosphoribosylamine--glycine ligase [Flavobacteriaceae bacterium]MBL6678508.1 phosphoribosylamine--glycine ligase [Flavobacteriaceae bacterium]
MNVLVLGSGGREHAIITSFTNSKLVNKIYALPGNGGTGTIATNIQGDVNDFKKIKEEVINNNISLVFVGPEDPIVNGIYDFFKSDNYLKNIKIIAPSKLAGQLEGSKEFAKKFMERYNIPTAKHGTFTKDNIDQSDAFLENMNPPYVLKADGLAAGKGVLIIDNLQNAKDELRSMILDKKFGDSSSKVVIEEFLDGIELSCFVLTDGMNYKTLPFAKDYKKIGEGDTGLNTGGMGAISPIPFLDNKFLEKIEERIIKPTIHGIKKENMEYMGVVFIGLIKVGKDPYVIEYNVRMGDPETEVVFPRIKNDLLDLFNSMGSTEFEDIKLQIDDRHAATIIMVSGGYPLDYEKNKIISGLTEETDSIIFHAGTKKVDDNFLTNGGRVIAVTSLSENYKDAVKSSYDQIKKISFDQAYFRQDIGFDL